MRKGQGKGCSDLLFFSRGDSQGIFVLEIANLSAHGFFFHICLSQNASNRRTVICEENHKFCGSSSVGRASAFQAECREFESRLPLYCLPKTSLREFSFPNVSKRRPARGACLSKTSLREFSFAAGACLSKTSLREFSFAASA